MIHPAKSLFDFFKTTLIGGLLIVLPVGLSAFFVVKALDMIQFVIDPVMVKLPESIRFPRIVAALLCVLGCFAVGLLVRTSLGKWVAGTFEKYLLNYIPGYTIFRAITNQLKGDESAGQFSPVLVELEDALVPAVEVERHADGRRTVFVPSAPTPGVGSIYILTPERVHALDMPLGKAMGCVMKWGVGARDLVAAMRPEPAAAILPAAPDGAPGQSHQAIKQ